MKTQRELLQEIMALATAHPDLAIRVCADADELLADYGWTVMEISSAEISPWYEKDEIVLTYESEIMDVIRDAIVDDYDGKPDEELEMAAKEIYDREIREVICIYTHPAGVIK